MKHFTILLGLLIISTSNLSAQSNPQVLAPGIGVKRIMTIQNGAIRVAMDPITHELYYTLTDGNIYQVMQPDSVSAHDSLVYTTAQHGVQYVQGMTFHDSTLYLTGNNNSTTPLTKGIVTRGKLQPNGSRAWDTLMITGDYQTADFFDHMFTGITLNAAGDTVFVCSGARGDHGEIQSRYGTYPGLRNVPITTLILALPANDTNLITLLNDSVFLDTCVYVFSRGIRSTFDMAFDSNGNLFGVENSGDYDHNEEMNLLLRNHHYGFPWKMGDSFNPQQFPSFNPATDPLINRYSRAWRNGFWNNDLTFPPLPSGITFDAPIKNYGPDCDKYRDSTGAIKDASDSGIALGTFTAHRSPLGLVFDNAHVLGSHYSGDGFMLSWTKGYDSCGCTIIPDSTAGVFVDPSQDLVHLDISFDSLAGTFRLNATRIIGEFDHPVDADIDNNKIYVIENGYAGTSGIYEVTFMDTLPCNPVLSIDIPNPCNPDSNSVSIPAFGVLPDYVSWYDSMGGFLQSDIVYALSDTIFSLPQGAYYVVYSDSGGVCGTDTTSFVIPYYVSVTVDSVRHTTCIGCADGIVYFTVNGGTPPYLINIPGGISWNDSVTGLIAGPYVISVTDSNSCTAVSPTAILDDPTFVSSLSKKPDFLVYPNPNQGVVSLQFDVKENFLIRIRDVNGKVVKRNEFDNQIGKENKYEFDCADLENGCYTIEIQTTNNKFFRKLVLLK